MKKFFLISIYFLLSLMFVLPTYGEVKTSLSLPENANIPTKASITTEYEKVDPNYSKYLNYEGCAGGEACFVMGLGALGIEMSQEEINKAAEHNITTGCNSRDLYVASLNLGILTETYWIWDIRSNKEREQYLRSIEYFISKGYPVVISWTENPEELIDDFCSFVLVVGYDTEKDEIRVLDPYRGPETGRIFSSKDFFDRWQWDNSDGTYAFHMLVIKGKEEPKLNELAFTISKGEKVTLLYEFENTGGDFFYADYDHSIMTLSIELRDDYNNYLDDYVLNKANSNSFYFMGGGRNYITITSRKGGGQVKIRYESGKLSRTDK
ncbi:MAG: C39 family peptidase [Deltaproteobacteria bacterium]|nr:C39 family peptidase [Candidatus Zymogenaceae bacterium]